MNNDFFLRWVQLHALVAGPPAMSGRSLTSFPVHLQLPLLQTPPPNYYSS